MQTDSESLLTDLDRARLDRWAGSLEQNKIYWHRGQQLAEIAATIARELARLEQENQWLDYDKQGLEECLKACRYERDTTRAALDAARAEVQRLKENEEHLTCLATSASALTAARAEVQRLRAELEKANSFTANQSLANVTEERDHLRAEAEKAQATRDEWQRALDHLEEENARLRNTLRLSLILSEPRQAERVMERIEKLEGDASRIALLEGRIQGVTEAAKERLDSHDFRLRALEANRWAGPNVPYLASDLPPFNSGYVDDNPNAEDLLPKGDLR